MKKNKTTCELCGMPVKVVGETTKYYMPDLSDCNGKCASVAAVRRESNKLKDLAVKDNKTIIKLVKEIDKCTYNYNELMGKFIILDQENKKFKSEIKVLKANIKNNLVYIKRLW